MSNLETLEKEIKNIKKENEIYLKKFGNWLKKQNLSSKTINNHIDNVDFYINEFLCYYEFQSADIGYSSIDGFLGDWFISKAMWSSKSSIKSNATSIKKFYLFMLENGKIKEKDYKFLCDEIKEKMSDWLDALERFDNLEEDDEWWLV
ncbi:MAG: recombinase [Bacilli bacterium]